MTNLEVCRVGTKAEICELLGRVFNSALEKAEVEKTKILILRAAYETALYDWFDEENEPAQSLTSMEERIDLLRMFL